MSYLALNFKLNKKYKIKEYINESDFSNIYLVEYNSKKYIAKECFPKEIVVRDSDNKIFSNKYKNEFEKILDDFEKEYKIIKSFNDSEIVKVYDFFEENNTKYLILEYFKGLTLKEYILKNNLDEIKIIEIFLKILKIIEKLHLRKIIHGDIKPTNIMIDEYENIKLIDFDSTMENNSKRKYIKLTKGYSPIEKYTTKEKNDESTDIYSLCAMLYFMINKQKIMDSIKRFYYPELIFENNINIRLKEIIVKGLEFKNTNRYRSIKEIKYEVEKLLEKIKNK